MSRFRALIPMVVLLALVADPGPRTQRVSAAGTVTTCTEAGLLAAMAGGGLVTFSCSGTIRFASTVTVDGADLTIDGSGQNVIIDGPAGDAFYVTGGGTLTLIDMTLANSGGIGVDGGAVTVTGGTFSHLHDRGIEAVDSTITVSDTTFDTATDGIEAYRSTVAVSGSRFVNLEDGIEAGPGTSLSVRSSEFADNADHIYHESTGALAIESSTFKRATYEGVIIFDSAAVTIAGSVIADGGYSAIEAREIRGPLSVSATTITGNRAEAIYLGSGSLAVTNSELSGNGTAGNQGIEVEGGTVTLSGTTVAGTNGPGIQLSGGRLTATNSTISGNRGSGVLASGDAVISVTNSTIADNGRGFGGSGRVTLANTLVADNGVRDCEGGATIIDGGGNFIEDGTCGLAARGDPGLDPLAWNGGSTRTHALTSRSAAFNTGVRTVCAAAGGLDQRGSSRANSCSPGAYEPQQSGPPARSPTASPTAVRTPSPTITPTVTPGSTSTPAPIATVKPPSTPGATTSAGPSPTPGTVAPGTQSATPAATVTEEPSSVPGATTTPESKSGASSGSARRSSAAPEPTATEEATPTAGTSAEPPAAGTGTGFDAGGGSGPIGQAGIRIALLMLFCLAAVVTLEAAQTDEPLRRAPRRAHRGDPAR